MSTDMDGIAVAGSILVDKINSISAYPREGELTHIRALSSAVGGCVPNTAIDIKKLDSTIPVYAFGRVGQDKEGDFAVSEMERAGVICSGIVRSGSPTSFTEVMSVTSGQRTFFTYPGASAEFGLPDMPDALPGMLHLGYFLLLDRVDRGDGLEILRRAKSRGVRTSIDLVSENSERYSAVLPCLEYTDNLIINETEAGKLAGLSPARENLCDIAAALMARGVRERVIIHMPRLAVCLSRDGYTESPSYILPDGFIKGTTGAGDAFCAGALIGIYRGYSDRDILEVGAAAAVSALSEESGTAGVLPLDAALSAVRNFPRYSV